jgi:hypothetical protein
MTTPSKPKERNTRRRINNNNNNNNNNSNNNTVDHDVEDNLKMMAEAMAAYNNGHTGMSHNEQQRVIASLIKG